MFRFRLPNVTSPSPSAHGSTSVDQLHSLSIGDLALRTGLTPATLRTWESRHGFPRPSRRDSGHRRYDEREVDRVMQVVRRREAGTRLEIAIAEVAAARAQEVDRPGVPSVYAALQQQHPALQTQRLKKSTLLALSWAIEDENCVRAERPMIFGAFQTGRNFRASRERWAELGRIARSATVFADFSTEPEPVPGLDLVHLPQDAPMRREWTVVCDSPGYPAMLVAWELPGQSTVPDSRRLFEAIWSVDPAVVRDAARACAQVAVQLGHHDATPLLYELAENPPAPAPEQLKASSLLNRVVAYIDSAD